MKAKAFLLAVTAVTILLVSCGGASGPTAPEPPGGQGELFFIDNGCACASPPWPPIPIYVDGKQAGLLPLLGKLSIFLPPGQHTWSDFGANDPNPTPVMIRLGGTVTVNLQTNDGCADGCPTDPPEAKRARTHP